MDRRGEVVVIYCGRRPQPSLEVWVGQVGVVGYEPFYVWVIVELRRSIPKGTVPGCRVALRTAHKVANESH